MERWNKVITRLEHSQGIVSPDGFNGNGARINNNIQTMEMTLEEAMREGLQDNPEGAQLTIRILENHGDHLDISLTNEAGNTYDFSVSGNEIISYE